MSLFNSPEDRKVHPDLYLHAIEQQKDFKQLELMPYLPGPEYSIDMLIEKGDVITAIAKPKEATLQYLEQSGPAYKLAKHCTQLMHADGLINVQTRNNEKGDPVLLEINMRPSGGIGHTLHSGVNLPALFALRQFERISKAQAKSRALADFTPVVVRTLNKAILYPSTLDNLPASSEASSHEECNHAVP